MDKKPIAICFSDFHTAKWKQFNDNQNRTIQPYRIFEKIEQHALKIGVKTLLFAGDWNDHPKHMDNEVMQVQGAIVTAAENSDLGIIGIDGNHDFSKVNSIQKNMRGFFSHMSALSRHFICVNFKYYDTGDMRVHGIPYINGNADYKTALKNTIKNLHKTKINILLIHRDLPGAMEPNGKSIGEMEDNKVLKKYFKKFDLVLSGHIHKPQQLKRLGNHVFMLGATNQQRRSDAGTKMGYWILYSNMTMKFVDLKEPEFKYYNEGEEPEDDYNYWIKLPPKVGLDNTDTQSEFSVNQKRDDLVKSYLKVKGIKNKRKFNLLMNLLND